MVSMRGLSVGVVLFMLFVVGYGSFLGTGNDYYTDSVSNASELESYNKIDDLKVGAERIRDDIRLVTGSEKEQGIVSNIISALRGIGRATLDLPIFIFDTFEMGLAIIYDISNLLHLPVTLGVFLFVGLLISLIYSIIYGLGGLTKNER